MLVEVECMLFLGAPLSPQKIDIKGRNIKRRNYFPRCGLYNKGTHPHRTAAARDHTANADEYTACERTRDVDRSGFARGQRYWPERALPRDDVGAYSVTASALRRISYPPEADGDIVVTTKSVNRDAQHLTLGEGDQARVGHRTPSGLSVRQSDTA